MPDLPEVPFARLDVELPDYEKPDGTRASQPFSRSSHALFRRDTLKSDGEGDGPRTDYFKHHLVRIFEEIGKPVPYRFTDSLGRPRSMDGGCLKFVGPDGQNVAEFEYKNGYIVAVTPKLELLVRHGVRSSVATDIEAILHARALSPTERKQLIDARIGQGQFRTSVMARWGNKCAVTSCDLHIVVRASHILPWRDADNAERLDPENGLPLIATLDALFDAGLISFSDTGEMLVNQSVLENQHNLIGKAKRLSRKPGERMQQYLAGHRRSFGFQH
ncbi:MULTISPECIES: HNH endonuclease signature motif containing protein [unclassified Mesorhizobium]|uniref:HNH endonuclease n=1 Tax=unclassified Mesorhizobium TaxID=325217 RepID=UPI0033356688